MASSIDKTRFGSGWITSEEKSGAFVFLNDDKFDEKLGVGGAVPIRDYDGPWPVFGKPEDGWEQKSKSWLKGAEQGASGSSASSSKLASSGPNKRPRWMCKSTGRCKACPEEERNRPYCQPYGNRAPIECRPVTVLPAATKPISKHDKRWGEERSGDENEARSTWSDLDGIEGHLSARQETIVGSDLYVGYQICGRDQAEATWHFAEFVGVNLILALVGLLVLLHRQRLLAGQHQSMLARRIGRT